MQNIKVRFTKEPYEIERHGAWIDLRAAQSYEYKKGDGFLINLGVNIKLPEGCEGLLVPRSSTFKNFGLIQANSVGIFEQEYCGNDDVWGMYVYATRDGKVIKGDRICQFRTLKMMDDAIFTIVDDMEDESRGGWGSTGQQ